METIIKNIAYNTIQQCSNRWNAFSKLILDSDHRGWVLDWEMKELKNISKRLGITTMPGYWKYSKVPQAVFFSSQYFLTSNNWQTMPHRIGFSYFHGIPGKGFDEFDELFNSFCLNHERISRIQVSHTEMKNLVLSSGVDPKKVHQIPIGINLDFFHFNDQNLRNIQRRKLEIPNTAYVVGSFLKDGNGWGEGLNPKMIKGPDIFLEVINGIKDRIPELFVLLTGPSRGYVKNGLDKMDVPYRHIYYKEYPQVGRLYSALDCYLVTSRQEGGPKAILESMASGIPLVTTRVGQAMDLVTNGKNGFMANVEDVDGLIKLMLQVHNIEQKELDEVRSSARIIAEENCYNKQDTLWQNFMDGFVGA
jgi:glycosyltransferase involved in cell wall biosynthesis